MSASFLYNSHPISPIRVHGDVTDATVERDGGHKSFPRDAAYTEGRGRPGSSTQRLHQPGQTSNYNLACEQLRTVGLFRNRSREAREAAIGVVSWCEGNNHWHRDHATLCEGLGLDSN